MDWRERIRNLWVERMVWIRHYIISLMMGLKDLSFVATRALRNGTELARVLGRFYGVESASHFENLLTQHILLLSELASTVKMGGNVSALQSRQSENASALLELILQTNPHWDRSDWQDMINEQLEIETNFLMMLNKDQYAEGIANFDLAHNNALRIAHTMIEEMEAQFGVALPARANNHRGAETAG